MVKYPVLQVQAKRNEVKYKKTIYLVKYRIMKLYGISVIKSRSFSYLKVVVLQEKRKCHKYKQIYS